MAKKNLGVEATFRVLGKELTRAEAYEVYLALQSALNVQPYNKYSPIWPVPYRSVPYQPWWVSTDPCTITAASGTAVRSRNDTYVSNTYPNNIAEVMPE